MKCINCGNDLKDNDKICNNCGINMDNIEITNQFEKKKNSKAFLIITFLLVILGFTIGALIIFFSNENKNKNENKEIDYDHETQIVFGNYKLSLNDNYENVYSDIDPYIKSKEYIILYSMYPLNYNQIINNKEILLEELKNQNYSIDSFDEYNNEDENSYIIIKGTKEEIEYGFIFYEFDNDTNVFLTITSSNLSHFNISWFSEVLEFLKTNEKVY